jgi:biopolymer transport protein ExbD
MDCGRPAHSMLGVRCSTFDVSSLSEPMRFFARKRRQTPTVIVVALIDVLIVLLIFLMTTTTFKQQPALKLALPESSQAQKTGANENAPVVVSIDAKGNLRFDVDQVPVTDERLKEKLRERIASNPDLKLAISADKDAPFGQIVKVMDAAKEAKITVINAFMKEAAKP